MNILVGYDGSKSAGAAVQLAERHAIARGAQLEIVYAIPEQRGLSCMDIIEAKHTLKKNINELLATEKVDFKARVLVAIDPPGEELVKYARKYASDEIIIGVGKKTRIGKLLLGSTVQYVILNSRCPVVTVPYSQKQR